MALPQLACTHLKAVQVLSPPTDSLKAPMLDARQLLLEPVRRAIVKAG